MEGLQEFVGAHRVPMRDQHERERAFQRGLISGCVATYWAALYLTGTEQWPARSPFAYALIAVAVASWYHYRKLQSHPEACIRAQYAFLILDPALIVGILVQDPQTFAFLNPFLLVIIVRSGLRYGPRTMWLSWAASVLATIILLPRSSYWRSEISLTLSLFLLLAFVPAFFLSLIRRIHNVRVLEEERARVGAMQEVVTARSAFLAKVSHELRSPLQSIVSALDLFEMRHGHGIKDDAELIGRMRRSSMLLNTQLRDLLTLARGQAGRLELHPEPFEAAALVEGVALASRDAAKEKGLSLTVGLPDEAVFVVADGARIDQILTNLVVNSIRYTLVGEVRVTLGSYDRAEKHLHFTVADTGPGIPAAVLPSLFEPDKLPSGHERKGEGSGIGLAVVRTLVDHLGGSISVDSREGQGTTFELRIPAELIDPEDPSDSTTHDAGDKVLIVDDREDVLSGLTGVINELGYECDRASTSASASNLLASRRYHAVLLDIQLPLKSGAELAAETRRGSGPNRETRLLGMSAAEVTAQYADGPFDACLTKPIDRNALQRALREEWSETWPASTT